MGDRKAAERRTYEESVAELLVVEVHVATILARLSRICSFNAGATVVDVGAAQGLTLIACARQGYEAIGIEPEDQAREMGLRLAKDKGVDIKLLKGTGENIPLPSARGDVVLANSVIEHVGNAQAVFNEVYRILKPGGVFWFSTASSMCPYQREISGFPLFGWYPDSLKVRIITWAKTNRPHLVGYTETPAVNWFTPWKARRMLKKAGFKRVYDRWGLRCYSEGGLAYRTILAVIKRCPLAKVLADVLCTECAYAAVK